MATAIISNNNLDFQNAGLTICKLTGSSNICTFSGSGGNNVKIRGLEVPTDDTDAASKSYVDSVAAGAHWKSSVVAATAQNNPFNTAYSNGQVINGVTLVTGNRVLIKDQTDAVSNGIYVVQPSGAPARATDMAAGSNGSGVAVFVTEGVTNADSGFICTTDAANALVGTDPLVFTQFTGAGQITAGSGLTKDGNVLSVNVDDTSVEIVSDTLQVKDLGINAAKIAAGAIDTTKIAASAVTNAKLANKSVTVAAGDGISTTSASINLGASSTLSVDNSVLRTTGGQTIAGTESFSGSIALTGTTSDSGLITFSDTVAPTVTTNKLYSVGGALTYDGNALLTSSSSSGHVDSTIVGRLAVSTAVDTVGDSGIVISGVSNDDIAAGSVSASSGMTIPSNTATLDLGAA